MTKNYVREVDGYEDPVAVFVFKYRSQGKKGILVGITFFG